MTQGTQNLISKAHNGFQKRICIDSILIQRHTSNLKTWRKLLAPDHERN